MDKEIEENEPTYEAEECEYCQQQAEDSGVEYEFNVTWRDGAWYCDNCGGVC